MKHNVFDCMEKEDFIKIAEDLFIELRDKREGGSSYMINYKGDEVDLDTGYAMEGIEFFIKELKHKLNNIERN